MVGSGDEVITIKDEIIMTNNKSFFKSLSPSKIDDSLEMELTDPSLSLTDEEVIMELQILVKKS